MTELSCEGVLKAAMEARIKNVVVIGEEAGGAIYVAMPPTVGVADALLLMERAKNHLVSIHESYATDRPHE